jgi:hypothetical protein
MEFLLFAIRTVVSIAVLAVPILLVALFVDFATRTTRLEKRVRTLESMLKDDKEGKNK